MNSANRVDELIREWTAAGLSKSEIAWNTAMACLGWPYVFGSWGAYCTTAERRKRYRADHPTIYSKCQVLREKNPKSSCEGCKWFPDGERVRCYDCRGFTDWVLKQVGIDLKGEGCTGQWNCKDNWDDQGTIDTMPVGRIVCLFYTKKGQPKVMAHTGLSYNGETVECSSGVQHSKTIDGKWTHWALPKGLGEGDSPVTPGKPILKRGSKGEYVRMAQTLLFEHGYDLGKCGIDGDFGKATEAAVKAFQQDNGLAVNGIVDSGTWEALEGPVEKYTVTIPGVTKRQAEELCRTFPAATYKEE